MVGDLWGTNYKGKRLPLKNVDIPVHVFEVFHQRFCDPLGFHFHAIQDAVPDLETAHPSGPVCLMGAGWAARGRGLISTGAGGQALARRGGGAAYGAHGLPTRMARGSDDHDGESLETFS